ncbi:hypothetical protein K466DRAFT_649715 [Polyporus arcularius HHB13444]|uniref:Uncharacterized protein n=1 Tax=Polyporus arcularius HHB13444 TaxID=1314778 RepID=A0A5C3PVZ7_9APHY|nr:hypothetical protein K466DRAFT_649715 [Polyporus arcularius HHB13444]
MREARKIRTPLMFACVTEKVGVVRVRTAGKWRCTRKEVRDQFYMSATPRGSTVFARKEPPEEHIKHAGQVASLQPTTARPTLTRTSKHLHPHFTMAPSSQMPNCVIELQAPDDSLPSLVRRGVDAIRHNMIYSSESPPGVYLLPGDGTLKDRLKIVGLRDPEPDSTAVHSDSGDSEATVYSPLLAPVTGSEKPDDIKLRDMASISEGAPPADGTYMSPLRYIEEISQSGTHANRFYYFMLITMNVKSATLKRDEQGRSEGNRDVVFYFLVDTGSNTTWTYAKDVWRIRSLRVKEPGKSSELIVCAGDRRRPACLWDLSETVEFLMTEPSSCRLPRGVEETFVIEHPMPVVSYGPVDKPEAVVLALLKPPGKEIKIENCQDWNEYKNIAWTSDASFMWYRFGVCYAGTGNIIEWKDMDGIAGMGLKEYQGAFDIHDGAYVESFIEALSHQLFPPSGGEGGFIMFFLLRGGRNLASFLALNHWPCVEAPQWSPKIFVFSDRRDNKGKWTIQIAEIDVTFAEQHQRPDGSKYATEHNVNIKFDHGRAILDTGSSVTYFPHEAMQTLLHEFGHKSGGSFMVRDKVDLDADRSCIKFVFNTRSSEDTLVQFTIPLTPFLCNRAREGLIYEGKPPLDPHNNGSPEEIIVLGANFFQSAVVALHYPAVGTRRPYVRLARQSSAFVLPPSSE